jgi:hypothetical protein
MKIYITRGTHWDNPASPSSLHADLLGAQTAALALVNIMRTDLNELMEGEGFQELPPAIDPAGYDAALRELQAVRIAWNDGTLDEEAPPEVVAGDYDQYGSDDMAEDSGCDVWIEEAELDLPPIRIVADMSGGVLQGASIDHGAIDLLVVDYDPAGGEDNIHEVPQSDGSTVPADVVSLAAFHVDPDWVAAMFKDHEQHEAARECEHCDEDRGGFNPCPHCNGFNEGAR